MVEVGVQEKLCQCPFTEEPGNKEQSGGPGLYTLDEVSNHWESSSCWIVLHDKVYDVTDLIPEHPGGDCIMLENAGRDATVAFSEVNHSHDALDLLVKYYIGQVVENERIVKRSAGTQE